MTMSKRIQVGAALIAVLMLAPALLRATPQDSETPKKASDIPEPHHSYRLDFTISELEDGKKINSRQYSINLNSGEGNEIKIGTRVPVDTKQGEFQYLDVGTSIWCRLRDRSDPNIAWLANDVMLQVRSDLSSFAIPEQQAQSRSPIIRQVKIDSSAIATVGKQMVVSSADDPNSKRQFQLEVMVTRLK
jgi:hypothetical protein